MIQLIPMSAQDLDRTDIIQRLIRKELTRPVAAKLLCLGLRQTTRLKQRFTDAGSEGLVHKQRGQPSHNKLKEKDRKKIVDLLKTHYPDFGPTFACEKLREQHKIVHDPKTIRSIMLNEGLWKQRKGKNNSEHRSWRQRRSAFGELIQFDGSYHHWLENRGDTGEMCLLAAIDDATGKITKAEFAEHEGVFPVFSFWQSYLEEHGKPRSIYLDKFSTYKMNSAIAKDQPDLKTQFQRVSESLEMGIIFANSPQAKGRVERLFDTLQDRLVKELRLQNIKTAEEASRFLKETFIPSFNTRFSVEPALSANLHRTLTAKEQKLLPSVFSRQEERTVQNDFTCAFNHVWYQITKDQPVTVCKKDIIIIEEHLNHSIHLRLRGKELNYTILPERPKKASSQVFIAQTNSVTWKPKSNHPWRQQAMAGIKQAQLLKGTF